MKRTLIRLGLTALVSSALFGCGGGGSDGVNGATVTVPINVSNPQTVASNASTPSSASVSAWKALEPKITVLGVTINSPPVVRFAVTDAAGNAVIGLGNKSKASSATEASLTNLSFTLAKLVPASGTAPSKWVSYLVLKPLTTTQAAGTFAAADLCNSQWCATFPTNEKEGTLVDNNDGTYQYTFYRDIKQVAGILTGIPDKTDSTVTPASKKSVSDLGDVSFDASLTHRLGIIISGSAPGTGSNTPAGTTVVPGVNIAIAGNMTYDFRPDGGAVTSTRNVVDISSCASCHNGKGLAHGGARKDPNLCVTCHTDQVKFGMSEEATRNATNGLVLTGTTNNTAAVLDGRAIGNYPNLVHKIHMGDKLGLSGYNYMPNSKGVGHQFETNEWIQDPRNCTKCHSGADKTDINQATKTKDGDNWKTKPSRLACGACHDDVSFTAAAVANGRTATGLVAHPGGIQLDDSQCASCHGVTAGGGASWVPIDVAHRTEAPTANNPVQISGISSISYEISEVKVTSGVPTIKFRIIKDGTPVTSFIPPTTTAGSNGALSVPSTYQPIAGFNGGPAFYIAFAVPQDGVSAPADFNTSVNVPSLANLLIPSGHPKAGTLSAADANGFMVATLTGSAGQTTGCVTTTTISGTAYCANPTLINIPSSAKLVTGAMIGNFTQIAFPAPADLLTPVAVDTTSDLGKQWNVKANGATNYPNGTSSPGVILKTPLKKLTANGYTGRRVVVDTDKCESCHEQLGSAVEFHSGARNDGTACAICHNTSRTSNGWSANASTFIHGIHAGTDPVSVASITARSNLANCVAPPSTSQTCYPDGDPGTGAGGAGTGYSSGKRTVPFSWHRDQVPTVAGGFNAAANVYPGILKRCDNCHVPNAVNFGASGTTLLPTLLWSTSATGAYNSATDTSKILPRDPATGLIMSYLTANNVYNYGNLFSYTPAGSVVASYKPAVIVAPATTPTAGTATTAVIAPSGGTIVPADKETLVESPITAACVACHDTSTAKLHFGQYGGVFYGKRKDNDISYPSTGTYTGTLVNKETCLICHGMGRDQDVAAVHAK